MSYGLDNLEQYRRAAGYVDRNSEARSQPSYGASSNEIR
jgi:hypothetical protein